MLLKAITCNTYLRTTNLKPCSLERLNLDLATLSAGGCRVVPRFPYGTKAIVGYQMAHQEPAQHPVHSNLHACVFQKPTLQVKICKELRDSPLMHCQSSEGRTIEARRHALGGQTATLVDIPDPQCAVGRGGCNPHPTATTLAVRCPYTCWDHSGLTNLEG